MNLVFLKGDSIRWLLNQFPDACIFGCDILEVQASWPTSDNIKYFQLDQGNIKAIDTFFKQEGENFDLIIEDGSHLPVHQKNCLIRGLKHMAEGGLFILEDIHTSHPEHAYYQQKGKNYISALHLLLSFEHLLVNNMSLNSRLLKSLSSKSLFTQTEILEIFEKIEYIKIYRRSTLPERCYSCGGVDYNYHTLNCSCGTKLYSNSDSMAAIIRVK